MIRFNAPWARHLLFALCFAFVLGVAPTQAQTRCGPVRWGSVRYVHEDVNVYSERSTDESTLGNRRGFKNTGSGCDTPGLWCSTAERWTARQPDYQTLF